MLQHENYYRMLGDITVLRSANADLLAACVRAERDLAHFKSVFGDWGAGEQKTLDMLRAAIAKARQAGEG